MALYDIIVKPFARHMDSEAASMLALRYFRISGLFPGGRLLRHWLHVNRPVGLQREVFGLKFYNPLGLSAGLDRHGVLYNDLNNLGFSFTVVGPMGVEGIRKAVSNLQRDPQNDILAACINADYQNSFTIGYDFFDFFLIDLPAKPDVASIVDPMLDARIAEEVYRPLVLRLPPEMSNDDLQDIVHYCMMYGVDGVELRDLEQIKLVSALTKGRLPIIADNHIKTPADAAETLAAGASLIEVLYGLLNGGPIFVTQILKYLKSHAPQEELSRSKRRRQRQKQSKSA